MQKSNLSFSAAPSDLEGLPYAPPSRAYVPSLPIPLRATTRQSGSGTYIERGFQD